MHATCWSDYLCPWCYVGRARSRLLEGLGVRVVHLPYELHPEIPPEGRRIRADGRLAPTFERVAEECEAVGLPWRAPTRMPNTRRALATAEWVRHHHPAAFDSLHASLFDAHFARGEPIDDRDVLDALVAAAGAPASRVRDAVEGGEGDALVDASMRAAREAGVGSTPTWVLDGGLVIPGALDAATLERWVRKIAGRSTG
ncbi:MAG: DsbA family protein [Acidimicrobiales bacterium]